MCSFIIMKGSACMKIYFDKKPGKVYDLTASLFFAFNYDYYLKDLDMYYLPYNEKYKQMLKEVREIIEPNIDEYRHFFMPNPPLYIPFQSREKIWQYNTIDKYVEYIKTIEENDLKKDLILNIEYFDKPWVEVINPERIEELIKDEGKLINYLNQQNFSNEDKWNVLYYVKNANEYKRDFIKLIENYIPKFELIYEKYKIEIENFSNYIEKEINTKGINIDIPIYDYLDIENTKVLYIFPSIFNQYSMSQTIIKSKRENYMLLGVNVDKIINNYYREEAIDKNITIFKNLSDKSKYQFLKLLSGGEKYGQEIADNLGITAATISYHASILTNSELINVDRRENKTYYSLNKDTLKKAIKFIEKDLNL